MKTMKSVCIYKYGGPEVLVYEDTPRPRAGAGEILLRVCAAGVNPIDWKIRNGLLKEMIRPAFPFILGWDVSGVVDAVGPGVARFSVGDEAYSHPDVTRDGAFAEFIVIKESEAAIKPKTIDHVHAAALPLAGLTSWQALFDAGRLTAGQRVLIHGATGGVGHIAVQLAKATGAYVIGTASKKNHYFLRSIGADQVVDYETESFEEVVEPVDLVFDTMGGETQERSWKAIKPGGVLVSIVSAPSAELAKKYEVRGEFVFTKPNGDQLALLRKFVEDEKIKAIVETVLALSDATRALELSERGHVRGKLVLRVAN